MGIYESFSTLVTVAVVASMVFPTRIREGYVFIASALWVWILGVGSYYLIPSLGPFDSDPAASSPDLPHTMVQDTQARYMGQRAHLLAHPQAGDAFAQVSAFASLHVAVTCLLLLMARYYGLRRTSYALGGLPGRHHRGHRLPRLALRRRRHRRRADRRRRRRPGPPDGAAAGVPMSTATGDRARALVPVGLEGGAGAGHRHRRPLDGDPRRGRGQLGSGRRACCAASRWCGCWPLAAIWLGGLGIYSLVLSAALPGLGVRRSLLLNLSGSAVANVLPLGGAVATALNWRMVRTWGHSDGSFVAFTLLTNALDVLTKLLLPLVAVAALVTLSVHVPVGAVVDERLVRGRGAARGCGAGGAPGHRTVRDGRTGGSRARAAAGAGSRSRPSGSRACSPASGSGCCRPASAYVAAQVALLYFALQAVGLARTPGPRADRRRHRTPRDPGADHPRRHRCRRDRHHRVAGRRRPRPGAGGGRGAALPGVPDRDGDPARRPAARRLGVGAAALDPGAPRAAVPERSGWRHEDPARHRPLPAGARRHRGPRRRPRRPAGGPRGRRSRCSPRRRPRRTGGWRTTAARCACAAPAPPGTCPHVDLAASTWCTPTCPWSRRSPPGGRRWPHVGACRWWSPCTPCGTGSARWRRRARPGRALAGAGAVDRGEPRSRPTRWPATCRGRRCPRAAERRGGAAARPPRDRRRRAGPAGEHHADRPPQAADAAADRLRGAPAYDRPRRCT